MKSDQRRTGEIHAHLRGGIDNCTICIITENARALKFGHCSFEEERHQVKGGKDGTSNEEAS